MNFAFAVSTIIHMSPQTVLLFTSVFFFKQKQQKIIYWIKITVLLKTGSK